MTSVLVGVEVRVQAALAGVHEDAAALGGHGERPVDVERDRAVAHRREDDRRVEADVGLSRPARCLSCVAPSAPAVTSTLLGLAAEVGAQLHRLAQRVDGGVGDLARVEHEMVEDAQVRLVVAHAGEEHAGGLGLAPDGLAQRGGPVRVLAEGEGALLDRDGLRRAVRHAAVAGTAERSGRGWGARRRSRRPSRTAARSGRICGSASASIAHAELRLDEAGRSASATPPLVVSPASQATPWSPAIGHGHALDPGDERLAGLRRPDRVRARRGPRAARSPRRRP